MESKAHLMLCWPVGMVLGAALVLRVCTFVHAEEEVRLGGAPDQERLPRLEGQGVDPVDHEVVPLGLGSRLGGRRAVARVSDRARRAPSSRSARLA